MGRREEFLKDAVKLFQQENIQATFYAGDVRSSDDCASCVKKAVDTFGFLNVLINGAAGMFPRIFGSCFRLSLERKEPKLLGVDTLLGLRIIIVFNLRIDAGCDVWRVKVRE